MDLFMHLYGVTVIFDEFNLAVLLDHDDRKAFVMWWTIGLLLLVTKFSSLATSVILNIASLCKCCCFKTTTSRQVHMNFSVPPAN